MELVHGQEAVRYYYKLLPCGNYILGDTHTVIFWATPKCAYMNKLATSHSDRLMTSSFWIDKILRLQSIPEEKKKFNKSQLYVKVSTLSDMVVTTGDLFCIEDYWGIWDEDVDLKSPQSHE